MRLWLEEGLCDHVWNGSYLTDELRSLVPVLPFSHYGRGPGRPLMLPPPPLGQSCWGTPVPRVNYRCAGRPTGEENRPYLHADQWLKGQRLQPHGLQWVNLLLPRLTTRSGRQPAHLKLSMRMAASNLIKDILVGGYSFAFLKQGCYSFFSSCWQKLCGSGDLNAALTSQHFKEQSVSDIPSKQTLSTINISYQMFGSLPLFISKGCGTIVTRKDRPCKLWLEKMNSVSIDLSEWNRFF